MGLDARQLKLNPHGAIAATFDGGSGWLAQNRKVALDKLRMVSNQPAQAVFGGFDFFLVIEHPNHIKGRFGNFGRKL